MAILDRPMFQRRMTKDQLRQYGLPAFANGGVVKMQKGGSIFSGSLGMGPGQSMAMTGGTSLASVPRVKTADQLLEETYGKYGKFVAGDRAKQAAFEKEKEAERLLIQAAAADKERMEKDKADREAFELLKEKEEKKKKEEEEKKDDFLRKPAKEGSDTIDRSSDIDKNIGDEEEKVSDFEKLKEKYFEKSELYKKLLGNPKEMIRRQGFLQLAQFGLNLASAQGSNFLDKVAKSAKDPLEAFAELGKKAYEDDRAVKLLALEATEKDIATEADAELRRELTLLAKDDPDTLTNFEKNYARIIKELGPDFDKETAIRMARGLSGGESRGDKILGVFELLRDDPLNIGMTDDQLYARSEILVDRSTGAETTTETTGEEFVPVVITENMVERALQQNEGATRDQVISSLEQRGHDVSNVK